MALLEAMAVGVPVIATAVGGVPKVIQDGVNGVLVPSGSSQGIIDKIQMFKDNTELGRRIGRAAVDTINAKYDISNWCRSIEHQYWIL
jgi:glycosyltransferase involved in cell wall biosynthesis